MLNWSNTGSGFVRVSTGGAIVGSRVRPCEAARTSAPAKNGGSIYATLVLKKKQCKVVDSEKGQINFRKICTDKFRPYLDLMVLFFYLKEGLVDIFRQYGDHLYEKGDHAGAIDQYEKTIGTLEPSYVIRKFLDAQKIHSLTAYLQALHR